MILGIFRNSQPLSFIIITALTIGFWLAGWLTDSSIIIINPMPLYHLFLWMISPFPIWFAGIIGLVLVNLQVLYFNQIAEKHEILYKNSYFPAWFYFMLCVLIPAFTSFHPIVIANTLLLFVIDKIYKIYKNPSTNSMIFDACLLISIASLFYLPAVVFYLFFAVSLIILKTTKFKDWIIALTGSITPYLLVFVWYFLTGDLDELSAKYELTSMINWLHFSRITFPEYKITTGLIAIIFILSLLKLRSNYFKNVIRIRRYHQVLFIYLVFGVFTLTISTSEEVIRFSILIIPIAFLFAYYFLTLKKLWWSGLLFWSLSLIILFNYIYPMIS